MHRGELKNVNAASEHGRAQPLSTAIYFFVLKGIRGYAVAHKNKGWYLRYFLFLLEENKGQSILKVKAYFL